MPAVRLHQRAADLLRQVRPRAAGRDRGSRPKAGHRQSCRRGAGCRRECASAPSSPARCPTSRGSLRRYPPRSGCACCGRPARCAIGPRWSAFSPPAAIAAGLGHGVLDLRHASRGSFCSRRCTTSLVTSTRVPGSSSTLIWMVAFVESPAPVRCRSAAPGRAKRANRPTATPLIASRWSQRPVDDAAVALGHAVLQVADPASANPAGASRWRAESASTAPARS